MKMKITVDLGMLTDEKIFAGFSFKRRYGLNSWFKVFKVVLQYVNLRSVIETAEIISAVSLTPQKPTISAVTMTQ
jgi:hypothetical protein